MKTLLLHLLVFISLNSAAQINEALKVKSVFAAQQYTLTIKSPKGIQTYQFVKQKTTYGVAWFMGRNNNNLHKVIWDNYQSLQNLLKQNAGTYYSFISRTKHPISNYVTYILSSQNQSITFEGEYINIPKTLHHVGWMQNPGSWNGHP